MRFFYLLVLLTILSPLFSSAQSNYKPGYVVNMHGDTVKGFIDFKEWGINPDKFYFKNDINGDAVVYTSDKAKAFGITGYEYYQLFNITVSQTKMDVTQLSEQLDTTATPGTYFLKILTRGSKLSLYSFNNGERAHLYVADGNANPVELIIRSSLDPEGSGREITKNIFIHQLQTLAYTYKPGDEKLDNEIAHAQYDERQIRAIIDEINGPENQTLKRYDTGSSTRFFAGVGGESTRTKFNGNSEFAGQSHNMLFPSISAGLDIFNNKNVGNLIFRIEFDLSANQADFRQNGTSSIGTSQVSTLKFNQYLLSFNPQILYNFYNTTATKIYLAIGGVINFSSYTNKSYSIALGEGFPPETPEFPAVQSAFFGVSGKVGYVVNKKIDIYFDYNLQAPITDGMDYRIDVTQYKLGINYLFDK